jgi:hypothetical protein
MLLKIDKCPIFLDIYGQNINVQKKHKKISITNYFGFFLVGEHKNFYAVAGSLEIISFFWLTKYPGF